MKKNHYMYILAAAALTLGACSSDKDVVDEEIAKAVPQEGEAMTFKAASVGGIEVLAEEDLDAPSAKPRTIAIDPMTMSITQWHTTDKISISDGTLSYTFSPSSTDANCEFSTGGNTFITSGASSENTFYAFYPKKAAESWNGNTVTAMVWTEQDYTENLEGSEDGLGPYIAAIAETTDGGSKAEFKFGYICSVIDVNLGSFDGGTVESVSLLSNSGASLAGRISYNYSTKAITVVNNDAAGYAASNCISNLVTVSSVGAATPVVRFYVLPVTQDQGFTITVRTTDGKFYSKVSSNSVGNSAVNTDYITGMSNQSGYVCLPYYKKYNFGKVSTAKQNLWMATIPNNLRLRQVTLPGAHNAATSNVTNYVEQSKCQSEDIAGLLANGVRAFDLRPRYTSNSTITADNLLICHGRSTTSVLFKDAIAELAQFVTDNPSEFVLINMQKEDTSSGSDRSTEWREAVRSIFATYASHLLASLETYQNVGDARGKVVVISKNPYGTEGVYSDVVYGGIIQDTGDDTAVTGAYIYKQGGGRIADASWEDHYGTTNTNTKMGYVQTMLEAAAGDTSPRFYFTWNNIAYSLLGGNPSDFAATMNPKLTTYLTGSAPAERLGFIYADFIGSSSNGGAALLKAIIQHNHKYVYKGRTRKASTGGTGTGAEVIGDEYADDSEVFAKER